VSEVDEILVAVQGRLDDVPEVGLPNGFTVRDLDPSDPTDVRRWLDVLNAAFDRDWTVDNHRLAMIENPVVVVDRTFLAERDGTPAGIASIGRFRANLDLGLGHYLAVHPTAQRLGLATALCSHRYRAMAASGLTAAEGQTHLHRIGSLRAHFRCGFLPKFRVDPWNSLTPAEGPLRNAADQRLEEVYAVWKAGG
jgi:GNAT superfamily N-acetyltransferase